MITTTVLRTFLQHLEIDQNVRRFGIIIGTGFCEVIRKSTGAFGTENLYTAVRPSTRVESDVEDLTLRTETDASIRE